MDKKEDRLNSAEALVRLIKGNEEFYSCADKQLKDRIEALKKGQSPFATILSCSDSRITPSIVFNCGLGDIFEVRNAGNLIDDLTLGSLEYGVSELKIPLLLVLGHEDCGAVKAAIEHVVRDKKFRGHINDIVGRISPSVRKALRQGKSHVQIKTAEENVKNTIRELKKNSILKEAVEASRLSIVGGIYYLDGKVDFFMNNR